MTTDYGTADRPSRVELLARVLIACRDHSLPEPASISFAGPSLVSMFVDTEYMANEWAAFLGGHIKRDFFGWTVHLLVRDLPKSQPWDVRDAVDEAVADYEPTAELFTPARGTFRSVTP